MPVWLRAQQGWGAAGGLIPSMSAADMAAHANFPAEVLSSHLSLLSPSSLRRKVTGSPLFSPAQMRCLSRSGNDRSRLLVLFLQWKVKQGYFFPCKFGYYQ